MLYSGCSCTPQPTRVEYVDRVIEVKVVTKCIVPKTDCTIEGNTTAEKIVSMSECIVGLIESTKVCR